MAKVKATPVNGLARFVREELTEAQLEKVLARFDENERQYFTGSVLAHEMIPVTVVNRFTQLAADELGEPVKSFGRRAGAYGAKLGLKTVFRFLMVMMTVETVLRKAAFTWTRIYDTGRMESLARDNSATIFLHDFPSEVPGCARITGWIDHIGTAAGARNLQVEHAECKAEGGERCRWEATWS